MFRIREYNEDAGSWSFRYETPDGSPLASPPPDLTTTAQVHTTTIQGEGCANGVPFIMRLVTQYDSETGVRLSEQVEWINGSGVATPTMPVGFTLGACPSSCAPMVSRGILNSWI